MRSLLYWLGAFAFTIILLAIPFLTAYAHCNWSIGVQTFLDVVLLIEVPVMTCAFALGEDM